MANDAVTVAAAYRTLINAVLTTLVDCEILDPGDIEVIFERASEFAIFDSEEAAHLIVLAAPGVPGSLKPALRAAPSCLALDSDRILAVPLAVSLEPGLIRFLV